MTCLCLGLFCLDLPNPRPPRPLRPARPPLRPPRPPPRPSGRSFIVTNDIRLFCYNFSAAITLAKEDDNNHMNQDIVSTAARYAVAYNLQQQIDAQRSKSMSLLERSGLSSWLDLTDGVKTNQVLPNSMTNNQLKEINQLGQRLTSPEGAFAISNHLCLIASGLAPRPNRPDRDVIFRPYSSRDARELCHYLVCLLQICAVVYTSATNI